MWTETGRPSYLERRLKIKCKNFRTTDRYRLAANVNEKCSCQFTRGLKYLPNVRVWGYPDRFGCVGPACRQFANHDYWIANCRRFVNRADTIANSGSSQAEFCNEPVQCEWCCLVSQVESSGGPTLVNLCLHCLPRVNTRGISMVPSRVPLDSTWTQDTPHRGWTQGQFFTAHGPPGEEILTKKCFFHGMRPSGQDDTS